MNIAVWLTGSALAAGALAACAVEPEQTRHGTRVVVEVRPAPGGRAPGEALQLALVWSEGRDQLGLPGFLPGLEPRPLQLGEQELDLRALIPAAAMAAGADPAGAAIGWATVVAFADDDGDDRFSPTALDAARFVDRLVGWSMSQQVFALSDQPGLQLIDADGEVGELTSVAVAVQLLDSPDAACLGRAQPPLAWPAALSAELVGLIEADPSAWRPPFPRALPTCPGDQLPVDWADLACEPGDGGGYRYTATRLAAPPSPLTTRCGPALVSCVFEPAEPLPEEYAACP